MLVLYSQFLHAVLSLESVALVDPVGALVKVVLCWSALLRLLALCSDAKRGRETGEAGQPIARIDRKSDGVYPREV